MIWVNRVTAISIFGLCALLWPMTARFPATAADFPRILLILLAVLSTVMLVRSLLPTLENVTEGRGSPQASAMLRPALTLAVTVAAVWLMRYVAFFPAIAALGVGLSFILGAQRRMMFGLSFLGLMLFVFLVFQLLLNVPLGSTRLFGG